MSATQFRLSSTLCKLRLFLLEASKILGARFFGDVPLIQEEDQNLAVMPSTMVTYVATLKRSLSVLSLGVSRPTHGFSGATHSNQSHRIRSAREKNSRSRIPRPPSPFGMHTLAQETLHFLPLTVSLAAHSMPLHSLSKALRVALFAFIFALIVGHLSRQVLF